ncbi:hypothetical protein GCM10007966_02160 [Legionella impletisoli]|uniref:Protein kinase domain-containing protein n=2 Tax=Legionella impletisoli TaxID=343510 RepID=A0A917N868_9GAMM|nr:hypothetical protein GCM10007966_02160 [Legionella impletisoli]
MSQRADHLAVYPNYLLSTQYIDTLSYLFLKKQPGKEFYYLLIPVNAWRPNIQTRFKLSIKLLTALKEQVHDQGLVHRDIKPENILVAIEKNVIQVNIIDFAFACPLGEQPLFGVGTPDFIAPECYKPEGNILSELPTADYTIDVYAMAIVLKELWASDKPPISVLTNENLDEYLKPIHANSLAGENLSFVEYVTLFRIILAMAEPRPENRISLTQAIEHITSLMTSVFERHKLEAFERTQKQRLSAQRYKLTKIVPEPTESVEIGSLSHSTASVHNHTASSEQKTGRPWCSFFKKAIFCCTKHNSQVLPVEHVSSAARVTTLELHPNL